MRYCLLVLLLLMSVSSKAQTSLFIGPVNNYLKVGTLAGNRSIEFGVKNILEEYLQEKEVSISPSAPQGIRIDIIYMDVLNTQSNLSVFHKGEAKVVIRLRGYLINTSNTILKTAVAEQYATEVSMSTLVIDTGGKLNQQNLSQAIKKSCDQLVTLLLKQ